MDEQHGKGSADVTAATCPPSLPQLPEVAPPSTTDLAAAAQPSTAGTGRETAAAATATAGATTASKRPPLCRSRTDSTIRYTPTTQAEAPGATFYVDKKGDLDYVVLLKVGVGICVYVVQR